MTKVRQQCLNFTLGSTSRGLLQYFQPSMYHRLSEVNWSGLAVRMMIRIVGLLDCRNWRVCMLEHAGNTEYLRQIHPAIRWYIQYVLEKKKSCLVVSWKVWSMTATQYENINPWWNPAAASDTCMRLYPGQALSRQSATCWINRRF